MIPFCYDSWLIEDLNVKTFFFIMNLVSVSNSGHWRAAVVCRISMAKMMVETKVEKNYWFYS